MTRFSRCYDALVAGAGPAGMATSRELARAGTDVTLAVRTGASVVPRAIAGIPIQYLALVAALVDALRSGTIRLKGGLAEFTASGVRFADDSEEPFDAVVLATGYHAAIGMLRDVVHLDECGFGQRRDRVISVDQPNLYFVGHNYDLCGALFNIGGDSRLAAARIRSTLGEKSRTSTGTPRRGSDR